MAAVSFRASGAGASSAIAPPPGLGHAEPAPAKVYAGMGGGHQCDAEPAYVRTQRGGDRGQQLAGAGEWLSAVLAAVPHLDAQGLRQALSIVDCAIENQRHAKTMEELMVTTPSLHSSRGSSDAAPYAAYHAHSVLQMVQFQQHQQALLCQLHALRGSRADGPLAPQAPRSAVGGRAAAGPGAPVQASSGAAACHAAPAPPAGRCLGPDAFQAAEKPSSGKPHQAQGRQAQTLSTSLQILSSEDPSCLFIVRRINKLGFMASKRLKQHFSAYGQVARVLVAHSTVKQQQSEQQCHVRRRPSSLGFVHMASAAAVREVLAMGQEQMVDGVWIKVQHFERPSGDLPVDDECNEVGETADCTEGEGSGMWDQLNKSSASTTGASASLSDADSASA